MGVLGPSMTVLTFGWTFCRISSVVLFKMEVDVNNSTSAQFPSLV